MAKNVRIDPRLEWLSGLASHLNQIPRSPHVLNTRPGERLKKALVGPSQEDKDEAWRLVNSMLEKCTGKNTGGAVSSGKVEAFNKLSAEVPVVLSIHNDKNNGRKVTAVASPTAESPSDPRLEPLLYFWAALSNPFRDRLKKCQKCGEWFVDDVSRNKIKIYCSNRCRNRFFNRAERRRRSYKQFKKKST